MSSMKLFIPRYRKTEDGHDKTYTVYVIQVSFSGKSHTVEKRYSECEELHKQLKKIIFTPDFPPKKVLKWNPRVLEQRRHGLESYLQSVTDRENLPAVLCHFLKIPVQEKSVNLQALQNAEVDNGICHQPMLAFKEDPFLHEQTSKGGLPDIVIHGTMMGLYNSSDYGRFH